MVREKEVRNYIYGSWKVVGVKVDLVRVWKTDEYGKEKERNPPFGSHVFKAPYSAMNAYDLVATVVVRVVSAHFLQLCQCSNIHLQGQKIAVN